MGVGVSDWACKGYISVLWVSIPPEPKEAG